MGSFCVQKSDPDACSSYEEDFSPTSFEDCKLVSPDASVHGKPDRLNACFEPTRGSSRRARARAFMGYPMRIAPRKRRGRPIYTPSSGSSSSASSMPRSASFSASMVTITGSATTAAVLFLAPFIFAEGCVNEWISLSFPMLRCV
jgi:hypothetical protein